MVLMLLSWGVWVCNDGAETATIAPAAAIATIIPTTITSLVPFDTIFYNY